MVDVRKYYNEHGELLPEEDMLASEAIMAEEGDAPEGPTKDIPFRYTQQELSPRGEAISGRSRRDPRARSAIGAVGFTPGGEFVNALPTVDVTFGSGANQFSGRGYDINTIAEAMGISEERVEELRGMQPNELKTYSVGHPRSGNVRRFSSQEDVDKYLANLERDMGHLREGYTPPNVNVMSRKVPISGLSEEEQVLRGLMVVPAVENRHFDAFRENAKDKARGEDLSTLMHYGQYGKYIAPEDYTKSQYGNRSDQIFHQFKERGRQDSDGMFGNIIKMVGIAGMAMLTGGALGPVLAGALAPTLMAGGGIGAGILGGASAGLVGGLTAGGLNAAMTKDFNLKNIGMSAGMGMLGGGILGGAAGAFGGGASGASAANLNPAAQAAVQGGAQIGMSPAAMAQSGLQGVQGGFGAGLTGIAPVSPQTLAGVAQQAGAPGVAGALTGAGVGAGSGFGLTDLKSAAQKASPAIKAVGRGVEQGIGMTQAEQAISRQGYESAGQISGAFGRGIAGQDIFDQQLPDSEFYDPNQYKQTGIQEGIF